MKWPVYDRPGDERAALNDAIAIGAEWGYGNVIQALKDAWSKDLQLKHGMSKEAADAGALHICPWCQVDGRTGKKACTGEVTRD